MSNQGVVQSPGGCTCTGDCKVCVLAIDCDTGLAVSGLAATLDPGGINCVTDATGRCCMAVDAGGTYTLTLSGRGYKPSTQTLVVSCPSTISALATMDHGFRVSAGGCNGLPLLGATITIGSVSVTTGPDGTAAVDGLAPGTYPWSATAPRMEPQGGTLTVAGTSCQTAGSIGSMARVFAVGFTPTSDYVCIAGCGYPIKKTLTITHTILGTATATYAAGTWDGTFPNPPPGGCGCPPGEATTDFTFDPSTGALLGSMRRCDPFGNCPWFAACGGGAFFTGFSDSLSLLSCPPSFSMQSTPFTIPDCSHFPFGSFFAAGSTLQTFASE